MIYLLGGVCRAGKSFISKKMLIEHKIPSISVDHLRKGFEIGFPQMQIAARFGSQVTAPRIWPFLKAFIEQLAQVEESYLVEGIDLLPKLCSTLESQKIRTCFVGYPTVDVAQKVKDIKSYGGWTDAYTEQELHKEVEVWRQRSVILQEECKELKICFIDVSSNFCLSAGNAIEYLLKGDLRSNDLSI